MKQIVFARGGGEGLPVDSALQTSQCPYVFILNYSGLRLTSGFSPDCEARGGEDACLTRPATVNETPAGVLEQYVEEADGA
ncbi:MAG: hypothetical protein ABIJ42_05100 [Acidobacteriota bacterium]